MKSTENSKKQEEAGEVKEYKCLICKDTELVHYKEKATNGLMYEFAKPCECREMNAWKRRFKQSMIPDEFINANFENFTRDTTIQEEMFSLTKEYLSNFSIVETDEEKRKKIYPSQNFGLIAVVGEQRLKELPSGERYTVKQKHNNFGVGKTHLQMALSKRLIKDGFTVLTVSDVTFMDDLMQARKADDHGESLNRLLGNAIQADLLVWDDIGKVSWTEARERMYYTIINERYRVRKPIVFNSNEDRGTLADKIGYAAASRLIGECGDFLLEAEGEDWRFNKGRKKAQ